MAALAVNRSGYLMRIDSVAVKEDPMRRSLLTLTTLILILGVAGPVSADQTKNFRAHLNGGNEVPAVDSGARVRPFSWSTVTRSTSS